MTIYKTIGERISDEHKILQESIGRLADIAYEADTSETGKGGDDNV